MYDLIFDGEKELRKGQKRYIIGHTSTGEMYDCDEIDELVATIVGFDYLEADFLETRKIMKMKTAKMIGLSLITMMEMENPDLEDEEPIIMYDEVIGKIPYSYTGDVDYDIHGEPQLIRVECDETFLITLIKLGYIYIWERDGAGEYQNWDKKDLDAWMDEILLPFKAKAQIPSARVPLHKRIGE